MVIWDEPREEIFRELAERGITGEDAIQVYEQAKADRIATIRSEAIRRSTLGALWFTGGLGTILILWFGIGAITRGIFTGCCLAMAVGAWRIIDGVVGALMAPTKRGSLADSI
jgi:hypothetical protein